MIFSWRMSFLLFAGSGFPLSVGVQTAVVPSSGAPAGISDASIRNASFCGGRDQNFSAAEIFLKKSSGGRRRNYAVGARPAL
ncbi:MAG TPA: hypothetical protein VK422_09465, partial [Pyrinomonadaceae bacterium]|nr:hypothetical protein [Pyrinomonadaceae bacterium]